MHSQILCRKAGGTWLVALVALVALGAAPASHAATAKEIDANVDAAMVRFKGQVTGADSLLNDAKGVLVFPNVVQAGFGIGGKYGVGALRIGGKTVGYYRIAAGSIGFQLGAQEKDIIMLFMQKAALQKFRESSGWTAGVDGAVTIANVGAQGSVDTATLNKPIIAFVVGEKGLMYNLTLEGSKITKVTPD